MTLTRSDLQAIDEIFKKRLDPLEKRQSKLEIRMDAFSKDLKKLDIKFDNLFHFLDKDFSSLAQRVKKSEQKLGISETDVSSSLSR